MTRFYSMSIRAQLFFVVLVVALPAAVIISLLGIRLHKEVFDQARLDTQQIVDSIVTEQQHLVSGAEQLMAAIALLPEVRQHDAAKTVPILNGLCKLNTRYSNISIADRHGNVWASAIPVRGRYNIADRRYFKNALASGQLSSGEYLISHASHKPAINFAVPLKDDRGAIVGVVSVGFVTDRYRELLGRMQAPPGTNAVLIDHAGTILGRAVNPEPFVGKKYFPQVFRRMQQGPEKGTSVRIGLIGDNRIISYQKLHLPGDQTPYMYVTSGIPVGVVLKRAHKILLYNLLLFSSVLATAFLLAWRIGKRSIVDRVTLLEQASQRLAKGDLDVRVSGLVAGGELGNLGQAFDAMAHQLAVQTEALRESEGNYREIFNATHDAIFVNDAASGELLAVNKLAEEIFGYGHEEMFHVSLRELSAGESPYSMKEARQWIQKAIDEGPQKFEWLCKRQSGELYWSEIVLSTWSKAGKKRIIAAIRDITERKQAEDEIIKLNAILQQQTLDLMASNKELESFSYTLTHDLRSPLTRIYMAEQALAEMYGAVLGDDGNGFLRIISDASEHMANLIEAILGLAGVTRSEMHPEEVDLSGLAATIAAELQLTAPGRKVDFVVAKGVTAFCDAQLMRVVLENLLGNSWKYSGTTPAARIEFGVTERERETAYYVRDNGVGFDMKDADKLFAPFMRLHVSGDFTGTGIGLATVRRIVERHGGKVWAKGKAGEGAAFFFTL